MPSRSTLYSAEDDWLKEFCKELHSSGMPINLKSDRSSYKFGRTLTRYGWNRQIGFGAFPATAANSQDSATPRMMPCRAEKPPPTIRKRHTNATSFRTRIFALPKFEVGACGISTNCTGHCSVPASSALRLPERTSCPLRVQLARRIRAFHVQLSENDEAQDSERLCGEEDRLRFLRPLWITKTRTTCRLGPNAFGLIKTKL